MATKLQQELDEFQNEYNLLHSEYIAIQTQHRQLQDELSNVSLLSQEKEDKEKQLEEALQRENHYMLELENMKERVFELEGLAETDSLAIQQLEKELVSARNELSLEVTQREKLEAAIEEQKQEIQVTRVKLEASQEECARLSEDKTRLQHELETKIANMKLLENSQNAELQSQLKEMNENLERYAE
jgi:chromosome segregation ATPase